MTYKIEGKYYELNNEDMAEVRRNMKEFDISEDDAARMFFEDWEYIEPGSKVKIERVKDIQQKKVYAKSEKPRNTKPKERKVDTEKGDILKIVTTALAVKGIAIEEQKTETELKFSVNGNSYTLKLTKHRTPKKQGVLILRGQLNKKLTSAPAKIDNR